MTSWFGGRRQKQEKQHGKMVDDPTVALAEIGVMGLNGSGTIVFCNNRMLQILEQAVGRQITQKRVINQPLAGVLELPLSKSVIGHSLIWREELGDQRIKVGEDRLMVSTRLVWGVGRQSLLVCIGYYVPYVPALRKEERAVILPLLSYRVPADECVEIGNFDQGALVGDIVVFRAVALILLFLKAKDHDTFAHSLRTASVAEVIGEALELSDKELRSLRYAAALHDLGKLEIEPSLLNSTARLRPKQIRTLRAHAVYGARLLESYPPLSTMSAIVRHHHERFDGQGYPDGLTGEEIPFLSRIIAVADSIDAMAHPRPYRPMPLSRQQILNVLEQEAGRQFDPVIAKAAMELVLGGPSE